MEYLGEVGDSAAKVRLLPFNYSATTRFILELGDAYIRFWSNGVQVTLSGSVVEEVTPYGADDIFDVQFVQLNDVCYFTHPDYLPQKLTRQADNVWVWEEIAFTWPALADENITQLTLECDVTAVGATGTVTCVDPLAGGGEYIFTSPNAQWIGSYIQIAHRRDDSTTTIVLLNSTTTTGTAIRVLGTYDIFTYGTWDGILHLQRKRASGEWETVRSWNGDADRNIVYSASQDSEAELRLKFVGSTGGTGTPRAVLEAADSVVYGLVRVTGSASPSSAYELAVEVIATLYSTAATELWSLDAWNGRDGYPRSVTFHEQRLVFGGNITAPNTFWGSVIGDFQNFQRLGLDDSGFAFTLAATEGSAIQSMVSHATSLVAFTQAEEWLISSSSSDAALSPSNVFARRQSRFGSEHRQAFVANESILFIQRGSRKLREFVYSAIEERSKASDLTLLAEHVTRGGIVQMAFQQQPDPVIWAVTGNGVLLAMTYEREQNVVGWSRHITSGTVESVAVIYGDAGEADEVWLIVKRAINGSDVRYVERIDPEAWIKLEDPVTYRDTLVYSDAAKTSTVTDPTTRFTGFDHLEGEEVVVLADGQSVESVIVTNGIIELASAASTIVAGLGYTSTLQPAKTEIPLGDGSSRGRKWLLRRLELNLWNSLGVEYADHPDAVASDWFDVFARDVETPMNEAQALVTGETKLLNYGTHRSNIDVTIRQVKPLPANILAIIAKFDVHGD